MSPRRGIQCRAVRRSTLMTGRNSSRGGRGGEGGALFGQFELRNVPAGIPLTCRERFMPDENRPSQDPIRFMTSGLATFPSHRMVKE